MNDTPPPKPITAEGAGALTVDFGVAFAERLAARNVVLYTIQDGRLGYPSAIEAASGLKSIYTYDGAGPGSGTKTL